MKGMFLNWRGYLLGIVLVALVTWLKYIAQPDIIPVRSQTLYIAAIVPIAIYFGLGPALLVCILSVIVYDYFLIPPLYTITATEIRYVPTLAIFLLVGIVLSFLSSNLRQKTREASKEIAIRKQSEAELAEYRDHLQDLVKWRTSELDKANSFLNDEIVHRKEAEEALMKKTRDLGERVKELRCLYGISKLISESDKSVDELFKETVHLIPAGLYYPEIACARITFEEREFITDNFRETSWKLSAGIMVSGETRGTVEVCYLEEKPAFDEGPFLKEERTLIDELAREFGDTVERKQAKEALNRAKDELEIKVKERSRELVEANEQLRQYADRITQVQEEERKRIAYELHDDTAQYLSILKMQIGALADSGEIQSPKVKEKLWFLEKDADRAFNDVRRYSHELRPVVLEHQGLAAALEQITDDYNKLGELSTEALIEGLEPELPEEVKLGFFRIAQEALNNTRKHAKASRAIINLKFQETRLEMSVSDNGTGFDVEEAGNRSNGKGNLGLLSMQERAKLIGANLKIDSIPSTGTTITVEISI